MAELVQPLESLARRARDGTSAIERHHSAFYLGEATIRLLGAAAVNAWCASDQDSAHPLWSQLPQLARASLGHWTAWVREVARALDPVELRFDMGSDEAAAAWGEAVVGHGVLGAAAQRALKRGGVIGFFEQLTAYRNEVIGHGAQRLPSFYAAVTPLLLEAVLEAAMRVPWLRGGPWVEHEGALWAGNRLTSLDPWVRLGFDDALERRRVLVINRVTVRNGEARRAEYLDYETGETLPVPEALTAVATALAPASDGLLDDRTDEISVFDDYVLESELGRGAMGVVYRARQRNLDRAVALKCLPESLGLDPIARARFTREIRALFRCDHPSIVKVLAAGERGGLPYFTMELVEGSDLTVLARHLAAHYAAGHPATASVLRDALVREAPDETGATSPPLEQRLSELFAGAADGLHHLHEQGVIHRDVKPANLVLTSDASRIVVMDLGLAHLDDASQALTETSQHLLGTLRYMAPEQLLTNAVDRRVDVYGLGVTFYELLCGRPFLEGATRERVMHEVLHATPPLPSAARPGLPRALDAIVSRATARDPEHRYSTTAEFAADLRAFASGRAVSAPSPRRYSPRIPVLIALALTLGGLVAAPSLRRTVAPFSPTPTPTLTRATHSGDVRWADVNASGVALLQTSDGWALWPPDAAEPALVALPTEHRAALSPDATHAAWSDDDGGVWVAGIGGEARKLHQVTYTRNLATPSWGPDGTWLVFCATNAQRSEVHRVALEGSHALLRRIDGRGVYDAQVAPDGETILLSIEPTMALMSIDGAHLQELPHPPADRGMWWRSDGRALMDVREMGHGTQVVEFPLDLSGGLLAEPHVVLAGLTQVPTGVGFRGTTRWFVTLEQRTGTPFQLRDGSLTVIEPPSWHATPSPDGSRLASLQLRGPMHNLVIADGEGERIALRGLEDPTPPHWSADGREVWLVDSREPPVVWRVPLDGAPQSSALPRGGLVDGFATDPVADRAAVLWRPDSESNRVLKIVPLRAGWDDAFRVSLSYEPIWALWGFDPSGRRVAGTSWGGRLAVYDTSADAWTSYPHEGDAFTWLDDDRLLGSRGTSIFELRLSTGARSEVARLPPGQDQATWLHAGGSDLRVHGLSEDRDLWWLHVPSGGTAP